MVFRALWNTIIGGIFSQFFLTAFIVVGWTYNVMARAAARVFWKRGSTNENSFSDFLSSDSRLAELGPHAKWLCRRKERKGKESRFASLKRNFAVGFRALCHTWVLTLPAGILWSLAWWGGWNNSFSKGYENAPVGPLVGLLGVGCFTLAMLVLPMAQARHAFVGKGHAFFDLRTLWRLFTQKPHTSFFLSVLYGIFSILMYVLITVPVFFPQIAEANPDLNLDFYGMSRDDASLVLFKYFTVVSVLGFLLFVLLKLLAARHYASALIRAARKGRLEGVATFPVEDRMLAQFDRSAAPSPSSRIVAIPVVTWKAGLLVLCCAVWVGIAFLLHVAEFLNYHPIRGFLNHPLIQVPWFSYIPW